MPEQVFKAMVKYPSGKTRPVEIKLVNFRADPDDPDSMKTALRHANRLTPHNATVLEEGFTLVHDNPADNLETQGADQLAARPVKMQTETLKTNPVVARPTGGEADAEQPAPVSRALREDHPEARAQESREGNPPGAGGGDQPTNDSSASKPTGQSTGNAKRSTDPRR